MTEDKIELEIVIRGGPGAGKSQIAKAIRCLLADNGFETRLTDGCDFVPTRAIALQLLASIGPKRRVSIITEVPARDYHEEGCDGFNGCAPHCANFDPELDIKRVKEAL